MNRRQLLQGGLYAAAQAGPPNEVIEQARQAASGALKPSKRDLEHGLALHADSIVVDAYGFSPRSAIDGAAIRAAVEAGASGIELAGPGGRDGHDPRSRLSTRQPGRRLACAAQKRVGRIADMARTSACATLVSEQYWG